MIDTHCHIHDDNFSLERDAVLKAAAEEGVQEVICVGTDAKYSGQAVQFAADRDGVWASVGLHPHDAKNAHDMKRVYELASGEKVIAIGECGLDYYYQNSSKKEQKAVLRQHFEIATEHSLPMIFHIRGKEADSSDAYADFWDIYDAYAIPGVVHSFSAHPAQLAQILERNLYVGVNGIVTFVKSGPQRDAYTQIPLENLLLETDAPLLTPEPYRGKINEPKYISIIAGALAELRGETTREIGIHTSRNASNLFGIALTVPHDE